MTYNAKALKTTMDIIEAGQHEPRVWSKAYFVELKDQHKHMFAEIVRGFVSNLMSDDTHFTYRFSAPAATEDGRGVVSWYVQAIDPNGFYVPGHADTFVIPSDDIISLLKKHDPEDAIKELFVSFRQSFWDETTMREFQMNNYQSVIAQHGIDVFIQENGGYPFNMKLTGAE